jgi:quinol monooxygenase YgiN
MTITRINEFQAAEGKQEELFAFLKSLMAYIAASDGCVSCEALACSSDAMKFVVIEKWESKEAHTQSLANYPQEKMRTAMALIGAPPKGDFYCE